MMKPLPVGFALRARPMLCVALLGMAASLSAAQRDAGSPIPPPVLAVEESDTAVLPPAGPHRLFLFEPFRANGATVIDGDDAHLKTLGQVPVSRNGSMTISRDASRIFVSETYWSHGNRGTREDMLSIYDGANLALQKEIPLPGRLIVVPKLQQVATSDDEKLAYIYDMIPESAVHVVDLTTEKFAYSVSLPGCAFAYPFGKDGFATICGDGTLSSVRLDGKGGSKAVSTKPFFNPDVDPLFENSYVDRTTGEGWLLSFTGKIYPVHLAGATPKVDAPWSLQAAAGLPAPGPGVQELAWRPGGKQMLTVHRASRRLYILVHAGNHWTHKVDGTEVWVFDAAGKSLIRRITLDKPAASIVVTQDDKPLLYAFGGEDGQPLMAYDALTGKKLRDAKGGGLFALVPGQ